MLVVVIRTEDGFVDKSVRATCAVEIGTALRPAAGSGCGVSGGLIEDVNGTLM